MHMDSSKLKRQTANHAKYANAFSPFDFRVVRVFRGYKQLVLRSAKGDTEAGKNRGDKILERR